MGPKSIVRVSPSEKTMRMRYGPTISNAVTLCTGCIKFLCLLTKRFNLAWSPPFLEPLPGGQELSLMDFGPRLDEAPLPLRQASSNVLNGVDSEDSDIVLIVRMEVRPVMRGIGLGKHPDDDPEKPSDLGHPYRLLCLHECVRDKGWVSEAWSRTVARRITS